MMTTTLVSTCLTPTIPAPALRRVFKIEVRSTSATAAEWDHFAQKARASFRCSYRGAKAWQHEFHWFCRLRRLDLFVLNGTVEEKIGQCALSVGRKQSVFIDGIQLLPGNDHLWTSAFSAVLEAAGGGDYIYGSDWSLEPPREKEAGSIPGVTVESVQQTTVQVIDFERWASWDEYTKALSCNIRRNVKKAERKHSSLELVERSNVLAWRSHLKALEIRREMYQRKGIEKSLPSMVLRSAARVWAMGRYNRIAYLIADRALNAFFVGISFGEQFSYLEGASIQNCNGGSWHLLLSMIERAYQETGGRGKFVMGSDDGTQTDAAWEGLRRSRRQCCAIAVPTTVVRFSYLKIDGN